MKEICVRDCVLFHIVVCFLLALLELIAQYGFTPKGEGPSDFDSGDGRQQTGGEDGRPEEKPSDSSKPYAADQQEAVRR